MPLDSPYLFHSTIRLFAMVNQPLNIAADTPACERMELLCTNSGGRQRIVTYLSPLDALLGARGITHGEFFFPLNFQQIDTRFFREENGGWLDVAICYAFAADDHRLIVNDSGDPLTLMAPQRFHVGSDTEGTFVLKFHAHTEEMISELFMRAGMSDIGRRVDTIACWDREQLAEAEQAALARIGPSVEFASLGDRSITQCAVYDAEGTDWVFADLA